jgi:stearoyl-CoA desaturase (delta-9 desaturase)
VYERYARDLLADPYYLWLEKRPRRSAAIYLAHAAIVGALGLAVGWAVWGGPAARQFGASLLVWGVILRTVVVWHITWSVNSLTHLFGYRRYATGENSRNNWFVGLIAMGEGWHNNHHWDPASASVQHRWWELDLTYYSIRGLEALGLARKVIRPRHQRLRAEETAGVPIN